MFSDSTKKPLNLADTLDNSNQIQQIKSVGNQPRPGNLSPNTISNTKARALSTPSHVSEVRATTVATSDQTSTVNVTFKRDPSDYFFSEATVYVSNYKGNLAPSRVASGQSPISFTLENTGERVSVVVQANGNLGPAPLATAPNATLQLTKSAFVSNNNTGSGGGTPVVTGVGAGAAGQIAKYNSANTIIGDSVFTDNGSLLTYSGNIGVGGGTAGINFASAGSKIYTDYASLGTTLRILSGTSGFSGGGVIIGQNATTATSVYLKTYNRLGVQGLLSLDVTNDGGGNGFVAIGGNGGTDNVLRFYQQGGGANYVAVRAPASGITNWTAVLPPAAPTTNGQLLNGSTDGTTNWGPVLNYMVGPGMPNVNGVNSAGIENTSSLVTVFKFTLTNPITIGHAAWETSSGISSVTYSFGIYSSNGNTKLIDTTVQTTRNGDYSAAFTAVTLPPGQYWHAQTQTAGNALSFMCLSNTVFPWINLGATVVGHAANASTAGALPSTLGAITADVNFPIVAVVWTP